LYNLIAIRLDIFGGVYTDENDISAEKTAKSERARIQKTHENLVRTRRPGPAQTERQKTADRLKTAVPVVFLLIGQMIFHRRPVKKGERS
jgi:hypothetical protein